MTETLLFTLILLPLGLGLLGFIEPCSMGSNLIMVKHLERRSAGRRLLQITVFMLTRALFMGALGLVAALVGSIFLSLQTTLWIVLGLLYLGIGAIFLVGRASRLMVTLGPSLSRLSGTGGSAALGLVFGLNIPACAAPLLLVLLGVGAAQAAVDGALLQGFVSLTVFGLALSAPLLLAVLWAPGRNALDRLAGLSARLPFWTGIVLVALGLWSIGFGLTADLSATA